VNLDIKNATQQSICKKDSLNIYIKKGEIQLLLVGGTVPIQFNNQNDFEKNDIKYIDYGDQIPASLECLVLYTRTIFEYWDSKFGKS